MPEYTVLLMTEPDRGFTITVICLPGYVGYAETETEALKFAEEGIKFHIDALISEGQIVPEEIGAPRVLRLRVAA